MESTRKSKGKAIVFAAGGDQSIAQAIASGVMDTKMAYHAKKVQEENAALRRSSKFWREIASMRKKQVFETSMRRIHDTEARRSWLYINNKTCLFFGFIAGILFDVLLMALLML